MRRIGAYNRNYVYCKQTSCRANDLGLCVALKERAVEVRDGKLYCKFYKERKFPGDDSWRNLPQQIDLEEE